MLNKCSVGKLALYICKAVARIFFLFSGPYVDSGIQPTEPRDLIAIYMYIYIIYIYIIILYIYI